MQVCKINLNAEEYKKELENTVNQTQASINRLNQSLNQTPKNIENIEKTLKKTKSASTEAGTNLRESMSSAASDTKKAGEAVGALSGILGLLPPKIAAVGTAIETCLLGSIGWIMAAIGALIAIGTAAFKNLTESIEEAETKAKATTERIQAQVEKVKSLESVTQNYISLLQTLSTTEMDNNARKEETLKILTLLESHYGKLGVQIDETSGKIKNFLELQNKLQKLSSLPCRPSGDPALLQIPRRLGL